MIDSVHYGIVDTPWFWMARRQKRLWTDEEKRSICFQTTAPDVSVAQVARRYALNSNLIFKWLRDPRFAPEKVVEADAQTSDAPAAFLPVELIAEADTTPSPDGPSEPRPAGVMEIALAGGHRLRVEGAYDPDALARFLRALSEPGP